MTKNQQQIKQLPSWGQLMRMVESIKKAMDETFAEVGIHMVYRGCIVITANGAVRGIVSIDTGLQKFSGHIIQIYREGVIVTGDVMASIDKGSLILKNGRDVYTLTAGDVINWIVF